MYHIEKCDILNLYCIKFYISIISYQTSNKKEMNIVNAYLVCEYEHL